MESRSAPLSRAGAPPGGGFTPAGDNLSGTLSWTPSYSQAGSYTVTFTAANALSGSSSTLITVTNVDQAPVVSAPATASGQENTQITVAVAASDPDGEAIGSLTAAGVPSGGSFTPAGDNLSGTLSWTPTASDIGTYVVTFTAANALSGSASTVITVNNVDRVPLVSAPATASAQENTLITVAVTASDPDGEAISSLTAAGLPSGARFPPPGNNPSGAF